MTRFWDSMLGRSGPYAVQPSGTGLATTQANAAVSAARNASLDANANTFDPTATVTLVSRYDINNLSSAGPGLVDDNQPANVDGTVILDWGPPQKSLVSGDGSLTGSMYKDGSTGAHLTLPGSTNPSHPHALTAMTLDFYFEPNSDPNPNREALFVCGGGSQVGDFSIERHDNGLLRCYLVRDAGGGVPSAPEFFQGSSGIPGTSMAKGVAHRITLSLGPAGGKIYFDGTLVSTLPAHTQAWNNARTKRVGIWDDGAAIPANGAFDLVRIWSGQMSDSAVAGLEAPQSVTLPQPVSNLPLIPDMSFLASDGVLPTNPLYVYDTNLGSGDGSSPANAKEIQAAINAGAGRNLVAIAATPGGTTSYNRFNGITFTSNNMTLMARPGDTVIIDRGVQFAQFRTKTSGSGANWVLVDGTLKIWRSAGGGFGSARPLGGVWFEAGWPWYILPCDSLAHLQAPLGTSNIWTNYGGPCALVHTDGFVYVRWQVPYVQKMSQGNRWPIDARLDYMPGFVAKSGGRTGQLNIPATEDPRDYSIWLVHSPGGAEGGGVAFDWTNRSNVTLGEGINSFSYGCSHRVSAASNITIKRGTDYSLQYGIFARSTTNGPIAFQRRRMTHGAIKHQPLVNWKFGGPLEASHRGAWRAYGGGTTNNQTFRDCTFHGWHDLSTEVSNGLDIRQCTFVMVMDDGWQTSLNALGNFDLHYCYFLDSAYGGPGDSGNAPGPIWVSHCIFDNRCPRIIDCPNGEPYFMPLMQTHLTGGGEQPIKWYNNTIIWAPDVQGNCDTWMAHCRADNPAVLGTFHEVFNCIWVRNDYQRYTGSGGGPGVWAGHSDELPSLCNCGGQSKEIYDYIILHRDVPSVASNLFRNMVTSPVFGQAASSHGAADFSSLAAFLASSHKTLSQGIYPHGPGFFARSHQVNPGMPSVPTGGFLPSMDARRGYRPTASQASLGYTGTANSPANQSMASWKVKPDPWIGALDPGGTTCPVGVQNP